MRYSLASFVKFSKWSISRTIVLTLLLSSILSRDGINLPAISAMSKISRISAAIFVMFSSRRESSISGRISSAMTVTFSVAFILSNSSVTLLSSIRTCTSGRMFSLRFLKSK